MAGSSSTYYKNNPKARAKRNKQQARYNKTDKGLKIRTAANKLTPKLGTFGIVKGKMLLILVLIKAKQKMPLRTVVDHV